MGQGQPPPQVLRFSQGRGERLVNPLSQKFLSPPQRPLCVVGRLESKKKKAREAPSTFDYTLVL